jgi:hypothetical protein
MSQALIVKFIDEFAREKQRVEEKNGCKQRAGKLRWTPDLIS